MSMAFLTGRRPPVLKYSLKATLCFIHVIRHSCGIHNSESICRAEALQQTVKEQLTGSPYHYSWGEEVALVHFIENDLQTPRVGAIFAISFLILAGLYLFLVYNLIYLLLLLLFFPYIYSIYSFDLIVFFIGPSIFGLIHL